jgi:hypothetical protein
VELLTRNYAVPVHVVVSFAEIYLGIIQQDHESPATCQFQRSAEVGRKRLGLGRELSASLAESDVRSGSPGDE